MSYAFVTFSQKRKIRVLSQKIQGATGFAFRRAGVGWSFTRDELVLVREDHIITINHSFCQPMTMKSMNLPSGRGGQKQACFLSLLSLIASFAAALNAETCLGCALNTDEESPYTKYKDWEDAPASWEEYGHDNSVCGVPRLTVEQWEKGKYWQRNKPVIVMNVTEQWPAVEHWKK